MKGAVKMKVLKSLLTRRTVQLVVGCMFLGAFLGCGDTGDSGEPTQAAAPGTKRERVPERQFFDYRLIESEAGVRQWALQSEKRLKYSGEKLNLLVL